MVATEAPAKALDKLLFGDPKQGVYVVLDGASVPSLPTLLWEHEPEHVCLYRGELAPDLAATAPYVVKLRRGHAFTDLVLNDGWGKHWGIFALAPDDVPFREIRKHFRKFLIVHDPDHRSLYFRFYDPRVLQVFLPTCNEEETRLLFGLISSYLVESKDGETAIRFMAATTPGRMETIPLSSVPV